MLITTLVLVEELFFKVLAVPLPCSDQIVEPAIAADLIQRRQRSEFYSSTTSFLAIRKHDAGESKHVLRIVNINDKYSMYTYPVDPNQFFSQCRLEVRWRFGYSFNAVCCWSLFGEAGDVALTMDAWMFYLLQKRRKILLLDSHNHLAKVTSSKYILSNTLDKCPFVASDWSISGGLFICSMKRGSFSSCTSRLRWTIYPELFNASGYISKQCCLDLDNFKEFKLIKHQQLSHNIVAKFTYLPPTPTSVLGLPIGQHISCRYLVKWEE